MDAAGSKLYPYELAFLQFIPDASAGGERINIGVVGLDSEHNLFAYRITDKYARITSIRPDLDGVAFRNIARSIDARCEEVAHQLRTDRLGLFERQALGQVCSQIIAPGGGSFEWSASRYGVTDDLEQRVAHVYHQYIGRFEEKPTRDRYDNNRLWATVIDNPDVRRVVAQINRPHSVETRLYSYEFKGGWMNGQLQVVEPITFDYLDGTAIQKQAMEWRGAMVVLTSEKTFALTALVNDPPKDDTRRSYDKALVILEQSPGVREVIPASSASRLAEIVESDLRG